MYKNKQCPLCKSEDLVWFYKMKKWKEFCKKQKTFSGRQGIKLMGCRKCKQMFEEDTMYF